MASDYLVLQVVDGTDPLNIKEYVIEPHLKEKYDISTRSVIRGSREENLIFKNTDIKSYEVSYESKMNEDYLVFKGVTHIFSNKVDLTQLVTVVKRTNSIFDINRVVNEEDNYFYYNDNKYNFAGSVDLVQNIYTTLILKTNSIFDTPKRILTNDNDFYYNGTQYTFTDEVNLIA
jgi:hypothetical protein